MKLSAIFDQGKNPVVLSAGFSEIDRCTFVCTTQSLANQAKRFNKMCTDYASRVNTAEYENLIDMISSDKRSLYADSVLKLRAALQSLKGVVDAHYPEAWALQTSVEAYRRYGLMVETMLVVCEMAYNHPHMHVEFDAELSQAAAA